MIKYFLDTSAIWRIHKIKKYANFPITTWHYINTSKKDIELNNELKVLKTAIDYEKRMAPDELIYVTHDKTLAYLANYYFGEDSILII